MHSMLEKVVLCRPEAKLNGETEAVGDRLPLAAPWFHILFYLNLLQNEVREVCDAHVVNKGKKGVLVKSQ